MKSLALAMRVFTVLGLATLASSNASAQVETYYFYDDNNRLATAVRVDDPVSVHVGSNTALDLNGSSLNLSSGQSYINAYPFDVSITIDVVAGLQVLVDGAVRSLPASGSTVIHLRPGQTIQLTYSGAAPAITWSLDGHRNLAAILVATVYSVLLLN